MGIGTKAEVGFAVPVFEVVDRFVARTSEIGNLVAENPLPGKMVNGGFIETRNVIVIRDIESAVAFTAEKNLGAEPTVVIHLKHVDGRVGDFERGKRIK